MPEGALTSLTVYDAYRYFAGQTYIFIMKSCTKAQQTREYK